MQGVDFIYLLTAYPMLVDLHHGDKAYFEKVLNVVEFFDKILEQLIVYERALEERKGNSNDEPTSNAPRATASTKL